MVNMPKQYCFLCASDEGVFLDITADNKQVFHEQFEICALVKVLDSNQLPTKICYKCAYELNQCSSFVQRYKLAATRKANARNRCCSLCLEPAKRELIFDVSKDKRFQLTTLYEIRKLFNYELPKSYVDHKLICLSCRYTVDVLLDLKNICMETSDRLKSIVKEEIDYLTFPKIKTTVVTRKTTVTASARINLSEEADTNSNKMTRTRSQSSKLSSNKSNSTMKSQVCVKCHNSVRTSCMYKVHKTRDIVCKGCWKNMDIHTSDSDGHVQNNVTETKLCTVFLKDVLKDADEQEKSLYRIDEDDQGNKIYVITDRSLPNINKPDELANSPDHSARSRQSQKRSIKSINSENGDINNKNVPSKKHKSDTITQTSDTESKVSESLPQKLEAMKRKSSTHNIRQGSDSDSSTKTTAKATGRTLTRYKRATGSSLSDADVDNKRNRKKLGAVLRGVTTPKTINARDKSPVIDYVRSRRKRMRYTSASPIMEEFSNEARYPPVKILRRARSSRRGVNSSSTVKASQESQSSEHDEKEDIFETETYVCDECGASYENKLLGLTHKLRHYKQPKLKLPKLCEENLVRVIPESGGAVNDDQSEDLPEVAGILLEDDKDLAKHQVKDQSQTVNISVEDDKVDPVEELHSLNRNSHIEDDSDTESRMRSPQKEVVVEDAVDVELVMKDSDDDFSQKTGNELEEDGNTKTSFPNSTEQKTNEITKDKPSQGRHKNNCNNEADESTDEFAEDERVNGIAKQNIVHGDDKDMMEKHNEGNKEKDKQERRERKLDKEEKGKGDIAESKEVEDDSVVVRKNTEDNDEKETVCIEQEVQGAGNEYLNECRINTEQKTSNKDEADSSNEANCNKIENVEALQKADEELTNVHDVKATDRKCTNVDDLNEIVKELTDAGDVKGMSKEEPPQSKQEIRVTDENKARTDVNCTNSNKMETTKHTVLSEEESIVDQNDIGIGDIETSEYDVYKQTQSTCDPANVAAEVLQEVLDLASAEVQKRQELADKNIENDTIESETLENISREIQNTVDMPHLRMDDMNSEADIHL